MVVISKSSSVRHSRRRGAILVLVVMMVVVLIVTVVISVDVALLQLTRTQLRTATDAASRAATEALSRTQDHAFAISIAKNIGKKNLVHGQPLLLDDQDIRFGRSVRQHDGPLFFSASVEPFNTVQVIGRRTHGSLSGPVPLFFGRLLGVGGFQPSYVAASMVLDRDIVLVVDRSGSMRYSVTSNDIAGGLGACDPPHETESRWGALRVAVSSFVNGLQATPPIEYLGLVSFSSQTTSCEISWNTADINQPLSAGYNATISAMNSLSAVPIDGATNVKAGINQAIAALTDPDRARPLAEKTMIVLTDGVYDQGGHPVDAAIVAANQGIVIHTVTLSKFAEQEPMQQVAVAANGNHYHAPTANELVDIFAEIAKTLSMVQTK